MVAAGVSKDVASRPPDRDRPVLPVVCSSQPRDVAAATRGSASSRRAPTWRPPAAAWDRTAAPDEELHERAQRARQRQPVAVAPAPAELARPGRRAHLQDEGGCHGSEELFHSRDWSRYLLVGRPQLEPKDLRPLVRAEADPPKDTETNPENETGGGGPLV